MGNFEKLSVLVIVVIIVMILVVALYTWTDNPDGSPSASSDSGAPRNEILPPLPPSPPPAADREGKGKKGKDDVMSKLFPEWDLPGEEDKAAPKKDDPKPTEPPKGKEEAKPAPSAPEFTEYVVKEGDVLGRIAQQLLGGSSKWQQIVEANPGLDPMRLRPGTKLRIPLKGAGPGGGGSTAPPTPGGAQPGGTYTVRSGETLELISKKVYNTKDRWPDIWVANLSLLDSPHDVRKDMVLQLPR